MVGLADVAVGRWRGPDPCRLAVFGGRLIARAVVALAGVVAGRRLGSGLLRVPVLEGRPVTDMVVGLAGAVVRWAEPGVHRPVVVGGPPVDVVGAVVGWCTGQASSSR